MVFSKSLGGLSATQDNRLLESLASVIKLVGPQLTCLEFHEVEIVLANLTAPKRKPTQLSQAILDCCPSLQAVKFAGVFSVHFVWDLLLQSQIKVDLTSIAISQGKCLLTDYILSLLQAVHRHGCNIKHLQLAAYDRDCKRLNDRVLVALNYKSFRNLQVLDLSNNQLQCKANVQAFSSLTKLTSLNLSANEIWGPAFQQLLKALPGSLVSLKLRAMP